MTQGQVAYEAYGEAAAWRTFDDRPMPSWAQLGESPTGRETQRRWEFATEVMLGELLLARLTPAPPKMRWYARLIDEGERRRIAVHPASLAGGVALVRGEPLP